MTKVLLTKPAEVLEFLREIASGERPSDDVITDASITVAGYLLSKSHEFENDDEKSPEVKSILAKAYSKAGIPAEIEVYDGTLHGWCPPDSAVYNETQAERAWSRLLALYKRALA